MKYIGRYGEFAVLTRLLEQNFEAYMAIKVNQDDYDITVILNGDKVVRVQVKSTDLNSKTTNNLVGRTDKEYDYLVIVVVSSEAPTSFYVLTKEEAVNVKGKRKHLGVTKQVNKKYQVKPEIYAHENKWEKLSSGA